MNETERLRRREADLEAQIDRLQSALARSAASDAVVLAELRAAERRNSHIIDSAIDFAIVATDLDGRVTRWNTGARRVLGWSETEMLGHPVDRFFTAEDVAAGRVATEMRNAMATGRGNDERWHQRKGGERFWAVGEMTVLRGEDGAAVGFVKVLRDRTEQRRAEERQRSDAEFMRGVLTSSSDCIKVLDLDANLVFMSEGGQRVMEVSDFNAIQGCPWPSFWEGQGRADAEAAVAAAKAGGVGRFQGPADTAAGTPRFWDVQVTAIMGPDGQPEKLLSISRDITATWRAEAAVRESEARYRGLFEAIDEGFSVIRFIDGPHGPFGDYVHVEANPAFEHHLGIPNAVGQTLRSIVADDNEAEGWAKIYGDVLRTGRPTRFQRAFGPTGRHLDVAAHRVEPASRREVAVLFTDVTARKGAEAALRDLNETLERRVAERTADRNALWTLSSDIMLRCTFEGVMTAVNPAWTELLGWQEGELIGANLFDFVHPDDVVHTVEGARELSAGMGHAHFDNRYRHRDGSYRWISWSTTPAQGLINAVGRDVTIERDRTAALAQAQEILRQSQKMEAVGQLTGGVAHDFNNLLTIIRSSVDLLKKPDLPEARRGRYLEAVSDTVDRAAKLTGQLLAFARRQALKPEVFDVGASLRGVGDMLDTVTGARVRVTIDVPDHPCFVHADVSQFETALVNMAVNSRDAMDGEGLLTLRLACGQPLPPIRGHAASDSYFAAVSVVDTGSGIAPDQLGRIYEPFFTTKEVGKGTGLGLSQVFGFAKQSGGDVDVTSVLGRGTTFTLYLPESEPEAEPDAPDEKDGPVPDGSGQRVLVVEDNIEVGRFATQILQDLGYRPEWAANAESALERLGTGGAGFQAVFSDVVMPGMGGVALAEELRRRLPTLPVLLTSGYSHVLAATGDHGFELLHKP